LDALLLLGLEEVALDELVVGVGFYGGTDYVLTVFVATQFLLYLHLDLFEDLELAVMRRGLLAFF